MPRSWYPTWGKNGLMISPAVRWLAAYCLLLIGCGGAHAPLTKTGKPGGPISPDAPSWARAGDEKTDDGSLFVCEGAGPDEAQAVEAARALCSAKICELCGVEIQSTIETTETLEKVDVERKVVETCRRVRKSEEQIRYRQAGCGPDGCTAWLQVFFGAEAEARECRAYAEGNFADSSQCEELIERFRSTPDLTAESFRVRAELLSQAIVACAEIDVRPTPKLTALDEILWQGVVSPRAEARAKRPIDKAKTIAERLRTLTANSTDAWKADFAERAYKPIARQPLLESKIFVDRIAHIRDAMIGYQSIMAALEALVDAEQSPGAKHDAALVAALRSLKPVVGRFSPQQVLAWAADEISRQRAALQQPAIKAYFMEMYLTSPEEVGYALLRAMVSDERASEDEWQFAMKQMRCFSCATTLLGLPDHGGEPKRVARLVELSRTASTEAHIKALQSLDPEFMLRSEQALDAKLGAQLFTYEWLRQWLEKLPAVGRDTITYTLRNSWTFDSHEWRWAVTPAQHKALAERAWRLLEARVGALRCDDLDKELSLLESHGVDSRALEATLCRCVSEPVSLSARAPEGTLRHDGMRDLTELYQRLVVWNASCVAVEARGSAREQNNKEGT